MNKNELEKQIEELWWIAAGNFYDEIQKRNYPPVWISDRLLSLKMDLETALSYIRSNDIKMKCALRYSWKKFVSAKRQCESFRLAHLDITDAFALWGHRANLEIICMKDDCPENMEPLINLLKKTIDANCNTKTRF